MKVSRELALKIHFVLDECIPPIIRDSRLFMALPFRLLYKDKAAIFFSFKDRARTMTADQFTETYRQIEPVIMERTTDLSDDCMTGILRNIVGDTVLEAGCWSGILARNLAVDHSVTAVDMVLDPGLDEKYPGVRFQTGNVEHLPFADKTFDTVVCTNTLEHVQNFVQAVTELRRVATRRLIIVVPRQRPYRYTFDLHLHFFPYSHSLLSLLNPGVRAHRLEEVGGDWYYQEEVGPQLTLAGG